AGFTRYTACWRPGSWGEHPLGRACDFSAHSTGFLDQAATGDDKAYGDRLAAWFLANSNRLAVLYVIWYRQIWLPATGSRALPRPAPTSTRCTSGCSEDLGYGFGAGPHSGPEPPPVKACSTSSYWC